MAELADDFQERLNAYLREGVEALNHGRTRLESFGPAVGDQAWPGSTIGYPEVTTRSFTRAGITVTKASAWMPVSDEAAMDAGVIPDTRPRAPWHRRLRWRAAAWRERAARRAYRMIAGEWPPGEEYWDG